MKKTKREKNYRKLQICSHLLKKSSLENFIFCAVKYLNSVCIHKSCWPEKVIKQASFSKPRNFFSLWNCSKTYHWQWFQTGDRSYLTLSPRKTYIHVCRVPFRFSNFEFWSHFQLLLKGGTDSLNFDLSLE